MAGEEKFELYSSENNTRFVISLDDLDFGLLPYSIFGRNIPRRGPDEYQPFEVFVEAGKEEPEIPTRTCHICATQVPIPFLEQHLLGKRHSLLAAVAVNAMKRMQLHLVDATPQSDQPVHSSLHYCDACSVAVKPANRADHETSNQHMKAVQQHDIIQQFFEMYSDGNMGDSLTKGNTDCSSFKSPNNDDDLSNRSLKEDELPKEEISYEDDRSSQETTCDDDHSAMDISLQQSDCVIYDDKGVEVDDKSNQQKMEEIFQDLKSSISQIFSDIGLHVESKMKDVFAFDKESLKENAKFDRESPKKDAEFHKESPNKDAAFDKESHLNVDTELNKESSKKYAEFDLNTSEKNVFYDMDYEAILFKNNETGGVEDTDSKTDSLNDNDDDSAIKEAEKIAVKNSKNEITHYVTYRGDQVEVENLDGLRAVVPQNNYNGMYYVCDDNDKASLQCRLCRVMVLDREKHEKNEDHLDKQWGFMKTDNFYREIGNDCTHCLFCNEIVVGAVEFHSAYNNKHSANINQSKRKLKKIIALPYKLPDNATYCELCNTVVSNAKKHNKGLRHLLKLKEKHGDYFENNNYLLSDVNAVQTLCKICNASVLKEDSTAHLNSSLHQEKYSAFLESNKIVKENESLRCTLCDVNLFESYEIHHVKGRKHKELAAEAIKRNDRKEANTKVTEVDNNTTEEVKHVQQMTANTNTAKAKENISSLKVTHEPIQLKHEPAQQTTANMTVMAQPEENAALIEVTHELAHLQHEAHQEMTEKMKVTAQPEENASLTEVKPEPEVTAQQMTTEVKQELNAVSEDSLNAYKEKRKKKPEEQAVYIKWDNTNMHKSRVNPNPTVDDSKYYCEICQLNIRNKGVSIDYHNNSIEHRNASGNFFTFLSLYHFGTNGNQSTCLICFTAVTNLLQHVTQSKHMRGYEKLLAENQIATLGRDLLICQVCNLVLPRGEELKHVRLEYSHFQKLAQMKRNVRVLNEAIKAYNQSDLAKGFSDMLVKDMVAAATNNDMREEVANNDIIGIAANTDLRVVAAHSEDKPIETSFNEPLHTYKCVECNVDITNDYSREKHEKSKKHLREVAKNILWNDLKGVVSVNTKILKSKHTLICPVCNVCMNKSLPMVEDHIRSGKHIQRMELKKKLNAQEMLDAHKNIPKTLTPSYTSVANNVVPTDEISKYNENKFANNGLMNPSLLNSVNNSAEKESTKVTDKQTIVSNTVDDITTVTHDKSEALLRNLQSRDEDKETPTYLSVYTCKVCNKSVPYSENNIKEHEKGEQHNEALRRITGKQEISYTCPICKIDIPNTEQTIKSHKMSPKHIAILKVLVGDNKSPVKSKVDTPATYKCIICNEELPNDVDAKKQHEKSKKHVEIKILLQKKLLNDILHGPGKGVKEVVETQESSLAEENFIHNTAKESHLIKEENVIQNTAKQSLAEEDYSVQYTASVEPSDEILKEDISNLTDSYMCEVCNVSVNNTEHAISNHERGIEHTRNAFLLSQRQIAPENCERKETYTCHICEITVRKCEASIKMHERGFVHSTLASILSLANSEDIELDKSDKFKNDVFQEIKSDFYDGKSDTNNISKEVKSDLGDNTEVTSNFGDNTSNSTKVKSDLDDNMGVSEEVKSDLDDTSIIAQEVKSDCKAIKSDDRQIKSNDYDIQIKDSGNDTNNEFKYKTKTYKSGNLAKETKSQTIYIEKHEPYPDIREVFPTIKITPELDKGCVVCRKRISSYGLERHLVGLTHRYLTHKFLEINEILVFSDYLMCLKCNVIIYGSEVLTHITKHGEIKNVSTSDSRIKVIRKE